MLAFIVNPQEQVLLLKTGRPAIAVPQQLWLFQQVELQPEVLEQARRHAGVEPVWPGELCCPG